MSRLPFVVQPRLKPVVESLGNEDTGIIKIERKGYLTAGEKAFLQQSQYADEVSTALLAVVRKVSKEHKISLETAHKKILAAMSGDYEDKKTAAIYAEYQSDLDALTMMAVDAENRRIFIQAACMILYRVSSDVDMDEVMKLHPDLLEALAKLCLDEEQKSTERLMELQDATEVSQEDFVEDNSYETLQKK